MAKKVGAAWPAATHSPMMVDIAMQEAIINHPAAVPIRIYAILILSTRMRIGIMIKLSK